MHAHKTAKWGLYRHAISKGTQINQASCFLYNGPTWTHPTSSGVNPTAWQLEVNMVVVLECWAIPSRTHTSAPLYSGAVACPRRDSVRTEKASKSQVRCALTLECEELGQNRRATTKEHGENAVTPHVYILVVTKVVTDIGDAGSVYLKTSATNNVEGLHFCQGAAPGACKAGNLTFFILL